MQIKKKTFKVVILTDNDEMAIASNALLLIHHIRKKLKRDLDIAVVDNNSSDRTLQVSLKTGIRVIRFNRKVMKKNIVKKALEIGRREKKDTLIILDLSGGNDAEDAISLITRSITEGDRFASAYVFPPKGGNSIGCWAIDRGLLDMMDGGSISNVESELVDVASREDLEVLSIKEMIETRSKKRNISFLKFLPRSPLGTITALVRYHPLLFYSMLGMATITSAFVGGLYTVNHFFKFGEVSYFPALITLFLFMIGGFMLVAGIILNALNVMVERLEAIKKFYD